ncbi:MAG: N-6 DNA methylase [Fimbriimonadales bacterium]|nr:N-6 DNA methylase [Fimbriimonadales bacterium]
MLQWLSALASDIALTPDNLANDFGIEQLRTQRTLQALYRGLQQAIPQQILVAKLFEQWRTLFSEAIDYSEAFGEGKLEELQKWSKKADFCITSAHEAERFFFVLHTYFALLVKLIARMAVMRALMNRVGMRSYKQIATLPADALRTELELIESGDLFRQVGIQNLLEGDFFAWYLHAWNPDTEEALRDLLGRLGEYDPTTLSLIPEETRDLFKKLYHYLLPPEVRHALGEYYTPDWLAEHLLHQMDNTLFRDNPYLDEDSLRSKVLTTRFLDPACGSGTFLVFILRRLQQLGRKLLIPEAELLNALTQNVVGFDINPLAVLTARVNYLLAIADLLPYRKGEIALPVYLADSVQMPAFSENLITGSVYLFPTAVGEFRIPAEFCTPAHFNRLCDLLEECVRSEVSPDAFMQCVAYLIAPSVQGTSQLLRETYEQLLNLHRQGLDGLWARVLKNNFAPLTVGQFDYIVGNPPWVNWEHLPDNYRESLRKLWADYRLPPQPSGARLGTVKGDLSALMTLVVAHKLLKPGGKLGFVITQSLFKTAAGAGFRRFKLPDRTPLRVLHVDDMVHLQPFEGARNRTAVLILRKGEKTRYPVPYTVWRKRADARFTHSSTLDEVAECTERFQWFAKPAQPHNPTAQWLTAPKDALSAIRKVMGNADYKAHLGVNTGGANGVYWLEKQLERPDGLWLMRNLTEGAKRAVKKASAPLEPDLLYPLLRGRDVQRWRAQPSA